MTWLELEKNSIYNFSYVKSIYVRVRGDYYVGREKEWIISIYFEGEEDPMYLDFATENEAMEKFKEIKQILMDNKV